MRYNQIKTALPDKQAGEFQASAFFSFSVESHCIVLLY